jgi:hypothetical protein
VANGTAPLSYQWSRNGVAIASATAATYTTPATSLTDSGSTYAVVVTNSLGNVMSTAATLTVSVTPPAGSAPQITTQPASQTVTAGQTATFSAVATGTAPLSYQWSKNGSAISGATAPAYTTPATSQADGGSTFVVVVSNSLGTATSNAATLTVMASPPAGTKPQISTQPASQAIRVGQTATFSVVATGTAPITFQWSKNGSSISGATAAAYTTPAAVAGDNGAIFTAVATNSLGSATSSGATLTVNSPPQIGAQPAGQTVTAGQTATFSVVVTGTAPLTYQWSKNGTAISGATQSSYTTPATVGADNGATFSVVVTNVAGTVTSNTVTLTVNSAPQITSQPANRTVTAGQTATFAVVANGTAPLTYQWSKNGAAISGATQSSYTTPATVGADNGATFSVVVTNIAGSATSNNATLTVNTAPQITTQPANRTVITGQTATFRVVASGSAPLAYQWSRNGTAISGANSASYTTPATAPADSGSVFAVVVTNGAGSATSNNATLTVTAAPVGTDVLTYKYDLARTGQNPTETVLTPATVNSGNFGLLRSLAVDGPVDAQPLYVSHLNVGGSLHNVVYAATENDSVYAFDSDSGAQLWKATLPGSGEAPSDTRLCSQVGPLSIGVTATPVIDRAAGVLYAVAMTKDTAGRYHQKLHALDITTGAELSGSPVEITATYGSTTFDPGQYKERSGLLLLNGTIYTTWASHCDNDPYGGWIMAYDATTLAPVAVLNVGPGASGSGYANQGPGIWMGGGAPAADAAGNVYLLTGNGPFDTTLNASGFPSGGDYGNSFLKLSLSGSTLSVADYFTMYNEVAESTNDEDLGSGGALLLPDLADGAGTQRHLVVGAGKDGNVYVVERGSMGKFDPSTNHIWQELTGVTTGVYETPAYFNGTVYYGPSGGTLKAFAINNAQLSSTPTSQSSAQFTWPGTSPVVSANGTASGIVWAHQNTNPDVLHAYDASNLANELYNSNQAAGGRDQFGASIRYNVPVVAEGKVFLGTTNSVVVFGLLN